MNKEFIGRLDTTTPPGQPLLCELVVVDSVAMLLSEAERSGIGIESYLGRNTGVEAFLGMLNLKIIWSAVAIVGTLLTMVSGYRPWGAWLILAAFIPFNILWVYYRLQLRDKS